MRGSMIRRTPALRRLIACALVALLPACSSIADGAGGGSAPADDSFFGSSLSVGKSGAGNYLAGRFAQDQHDQDAAATYLLRALDDDPENVELLQRAFLSLASGGKLDDAGAVAKRLLKFDDEASIAAMLVAEQQAKEGNWAAAEAAVAHLPKRGLNSFMAPLITAWARMGEGKVDAALDALAPLAQTSGYAALHDFHAGLINDLADRRKAAEQYYQSTLAGTGGLTLRSAETVAAFYRRIGQPAKAAEVFTRYQHEHPDTAALDPGAAAARPVDSAAAGMSEALFGAAGSLRQGNAPELALIFGRMALDLRPNFPLAQVMVADVLQGLGQLQAANAMFRAVDPASPVYWSAQLRVAANLDDLGDVDGAVKILEMLAAQHPERPDALITLGDVLRRHKRWPEAVKAYDRAVASFQQPEREQWGVYYSRGIALERDKQWTRAESDFLRALELEPDEPHVLNYLGYSWIEQGTNLDEAKRMIAKAAELRPTDGYIVDSLGWAYYRAGDYTKAVDALERAVELHPEDATINDHLGDALWSVGRQEEARFQWRRALVFDPEPDLKAELERKLNVGLASPAATPAKSTAVR